MTAGRVPIVMLGAGVVLIAAMAVAGWLVELRINMTPSYSHGLWRIEELDRPVAAGDLVFICPPDTAVFARAIPRSATSVPSLWS